jgi:predicted dehydrogenase
MLRELERDAPAKTRARRLAERYGVEKVYTDYRQLLEETKPDVVSVCTWPHLHREMVEAAIASGAKGIHAEKPMAPTYGDAKAMYEAAEKAGVTMTFCHQRRFNPEFRKARELLRNGAIGEVVRLEGYCSNLYDWGTR